MLFTYSTTNSFICKLGINGDQIGSALTDNAACLHPVLVDLHQVVSQVAQLWLHALWKRQLDVLMVL